ncbi:caspase domain-containing protein [Cyathus striatus]|nr:caspase domain-containing protein [Cyathus striatus]
MEDRELISPTSPVSPTKTEAVPAVFALVIGINKYVIPGNDLTAAKTDADAFETFLVNKLQVPNENIISLRDEEATRDKILDGFKQLRDNTNIKKDDAAIVIYYAGHGTRTDKPEEWGEEWITLGGQIEMLCPSDIWTVKTNATEEEEQVVEGIPDRTISVLLNQISSLKGDNITLILDCCHSAGISRSANVESDQEDHYIPRCMPNPPGARLSANCDQKIWTRGTRSATVAQGFSGKYHASHVLLAACGRQQFANENTVTRRGVFTYALLEILNNSNLTDLTYTSLMHKLQLPEKIAKRQVPHCEGHNVNRRLFNRKATGADGSFSGLAQGITVGSKLSAHASNLVTDMSHSNPEKGHLIVTEIGVFSSRLKVVPGSTLSELPQPFYCRITELAQRQLSIYSNERTWLESVFPYEEQKSLSVTISDTPENADLEMIIEDEEISLYRNDPLITPHIGRKLPHTVNMNSYDSTATIREVARAALKFTHHLTRTGDEMKNVWMELKKLKVEITKDYDQVHTPYGENLLEKDPATVVVDEEERLGMTIFNQSDVSLYPYLFYFDPSDYTIIEWYTPPFGAGVGRLTARVDAPLPAKSMLTIGYGDGGVPPWQFLLRPGETKDVGFFKLFLTTRATNLSNICQESPFEARKTRYGQAAAAQRPDTVRWATQMSTVIQVAPS